jgi:hypothetical protein
MLLVLSAQLLMTGCGRSTDAQDRAAGDGEPPPPSELRSLAGVRTRIVWVQHDGSDPETEGDQLILMGLDSDDGVGERVIRGERGSYLKPRLTSDGERIVVSSRVLPGPPEVFIVNWDGSGFRKLADGFAMTLWRNPQDGRDWVYVGSDNTNYDFATVTRFPIDAPAEREVVWSGSLVSMEGFNVSPDGRLAGGLFPWPDAGVASLPNGEITRFGEGCWTGLTFARGPLFWYFDGAHRNVTLVDVDTRARWMVNLNAVPGFNGAEVSHPRWTNHPRFLALTGPYNQGGGNQVRSGGPQVELYVGRFSEDFSKVEAWARVTNNGAGDAHPDVWMDVGSSPYPVRPAGRIGPPDAVAARTRAGGAPAGRGRLVLNVRLEQPGPIPTPESILPYRNALVVNEYEVADVIEGDYDADWIQVAQWAIRDGKVLPDAQKTAGSGFTLTVDRFDDHPELEGERLISNAEPTDLPLYYQPGAP